MHRLLLKPPTTFTLDVTFHLASQDVFGYVRIHFSLGGITYFRQESLENYKVDKSVEVQD